MSDALYGRGLYVFTGLSTGSKSPTLDPTASTWVKPPLPGQRAYETDTKNVYEFDTASWLKIRGTNSNGDPAVSAVAEIGDGQASEKTYSAWIFGDDSTTVSTVANTAKASNAVDVSLLNPNNYSINHIITGSSAGNYIVESSRNGVDDWVQVFTAVYTAVGGYSIKGSDIDYAEFIRVTSTDSSATAGTVNTSLSGKGG